MSLGGQASGERSGGGGGGEDNSSGPEKTTAATAALSFQHLFRAECSSGSFHRMGTQKNQLQFASSAEDDRNLQIQSDAAFGVH